MDLPLHLSCLQSCLTHTSELKFLSINSLLWKYFSSYYHLNNRTLQNLRKFSCLEMFGFDCMSMRLKENILITPHIFKGKVSKYFGFISLAKHPLPIATDISDNWSSFRIFMTIFIEILCSLFCYFMNCIFFYALIYSIPFLLCILCKRFLFV